MKISKALRGQRSLLAGAATLALAAGAVATPAHAIVPNDNVGAEGAVDNDDVYSGVGMFFRADGFVCSGTLINPRTVLFAAHCVNDRPESDYAVNGPIRSAWSFNVNALPGFQTWFNNGFNSDSSVNVFNVNQILYDPRSLQNPQAAGFIEADIAIASLDTPAAGLPTWSLLFSPLPTPDRILPQTGTGYHVDITGYGRSGIGSLGDVQGIDWRRRSAENMLGSLASLDQRNTFLFGGPAGLPQVLYSLDFDDPNETNPFDFNLFMDEPLEREGTTAGGDSGGPLILDAANNEITDEDLVIGVLSGGSAFFLLPSGDPNFSAYGSQSFYQPLFLYWDYIVANNPYRYVTAQAGDGNWEDADHWVTTLDPNYRVIDTSGEIVNGVPTAPGAGLDGDSPSFGGVCFDPRGFNRLDACVDLETGDPLVPARQANGEGGEAAEGGEGDPTATLANGRGELDPSELQDIAINGEGLTLEGVADVAITTRLGLVEIGDIAISGDVNGVEFAENRPDEGVDFVVDASQEDGEGGEEGPEPGFSADPLPDPTLANGLPGATGFVPDNVDPDGTVGPRYYDVTLANAGTTTLSSEVTIDRLTVQSSAGLNIAAPGGEGEAGEGGILNVLNNVSQFGGTVTVDGQLNSVGDYTLFGGALQGSGTVAAPFVTNIMGAISPGTIGGIDTLNIDGSAVLASGSSLLIDIDEAGNSDTLNVTGDINVGGVVAVGAGITNQVNGLGQVYTIVTADGDVTGTFVDGTIGAILSQSFTYQDNAVLMEIIAGNYADLAGLDADGLAYAQLFDQNRGNAALAGLYALDFADATTIAGIFNGLTPVSESTVQTLAAQSYNHLQTFTANRAKETDRRRNGGTIATLGSPLQTASVMSRAGQPINGAALAFDDHSEASSVKEGAIDESIAIYLAGGFINGSGDSLPGFQSPTEFDGYFYAAGFEYFPDNNTVVGISGYHSSLDADAPLGQLVESEMWGASIYASHETANGVVLDGLVSIANLEVETQRTVAFPTGTQTLTTDSNDDGIAAAAGIGYKVVNGKKSSLAPGVEVRYARNSFDVVDETGGILALRINRETFTSFQARGGFDYELSERLFQINVSADVVYEFEDSPTLFQAQFVSGTGPTAGFGLGSTDETWGEVSVAGTFGDGPFTVGFGVDATIGRDNANAQVWRGTAAYRF
jgi:hypothetical protein